MLVSDWYLCSTPSSGFPSLVLQSRRSMQSLERTRAKQQQDTLHSSRGKRCAVRGVPSATRAYDSCMPKPREEIISCIFGCQVSTRFFPEVWAVFISTCLQQCSLSRPSSPFAFSMSKPVTCMLPCGRCGVLLSWLFLVISPLRRRWAI